MVKLKPTAFPPGYYECDCMQKEDLFMQRASVHDKSTSQRLTITSCLLHSESER